MHTHKDRTEDINMVDIAQTFVSLNDRRSLFLVALNKDNYLNFCYKCKYNHHRLS